MKATLPRPVLTCWPSGYLWSDFGQDLVPLHDDSTPRLIRCERISNRWEANVKSSHFKICAVVKSSLATSIAWALVVAQPCLATTVTDPANDLIGTYIG